MNTADLITQVCDDLKEMLLAKNKAYGNAALEPLRIFSKASPIEQILVRLDDKLSRLARGEAAGEDVFRDFMGYLVLLEVAKRMRAALNPGDAVVVAFSGGMSKVLNTAGTPVDVYLYTGGSAGSVVCCGPHDRLLLAIQGDRVEVCPKCFPPVRVGNAG